MWNFINKFSRIHLEKARRFTYGMIVTRKSSSRTVQFAKPNLKGESVDVIKWFVLVIPVGAFGLGCWQIQRLRWKLDLIKQLEEKSNAEPVPLPKDFTKLETMEYCPVKVKGQFLHERELLVGPRALIDDAKLPRTGSLVTDPKKNQGLLVVTPFKLSDTGEVILVNRGWIPQHIRAREKRQEGLPSGEVELVGVVRLAENRPVFMMKNKPQNGQWMYRDLEAMSAETGSAPVWLDARGISDPLPGWPVPNQTRITLRNEHVSYLVTWFSLSGITGYMWYRYFVKRLPLA